MVVTTRNRAAYLRECLRSILRQTLRPARVVVSDDASTDATPEIVAGLGTEARRAGVELVYLRHPARQGQEANRRRALQAAAGDFVALLDDDDLYAPGFLEATVPALAGRPDLAFVATEVVWMQEDGTPSPSATRKAKRRFRRIGLRERVYCDVLARELAHKSFFLLGVLFRRAWLAEVGYVPAGSGAVCDFAVFCALGLRGACGYYLPLPLAYYRIHPRQQTAARLSNSQDSKRWGYRLLEQMADGRACGRRERRLAGRYAMRAHRELAIAQAHAGHRAEALGEGRELLRRWGPGAASARLLVLGALLIGVRRR